MIGSLSEDMTGLSESGVIGLLEEGVADGCVTGSSAVGVGSYPVGVVGLW